MNCRGPLQVKRSVVFRHGVLAIRLLTHFNVADAVASPFDVGDLRRGIVRRAVQQRHRDHSRQVVGEAAAKEKVEAAVLITSAVIDVGRGMPGIDRRNAKRRQPLAVIFRDLDERSSAVNGACGNVLDGVAHAVTDVA